MPHLPTLVIQIGMILIVGFLFRKIHQPQVMGEMVAGIILGPSLLGWLAPNISAAVFPPESRGFLNSLSQIGLLIFMFLARLELDPHILRGWSYVSILAPFFLGTLLALYDVDLLWSPRPYRQYGRTRRAYTNSLNAKGVIWFIKSHLPSNKRIIWPLLYSLS